MSGRGGVGKRIHADAFHDHGLFAHCRNPLYLGNLLIIFGLLTNHQDPWAFFLAGGFFLFAYAAMVTAEENHLLRQSGRDYVGYCLRVPRWFPRLDGLRYTFASTRFEWRRVLVVEYATVALWTTLVLADLAEDAVLEDGFFGSLGELSAAAAGILLAGGMALRIRHLKRSGRLELPV